MRFSGVTIAIVSPVKPVSPVDADKLDRSLRCLCTSIYSGAVASVRVIMFGSFFSYFFLIDYLSNSTINVVYTDLQYYLKKFFIEFQMNIRKSCFYKPTINFKQYLRPAILTLKLI